ncbi:heme exporter protein CcmD [Burkholderia alba]|uniref:heme exporter protein CcmD n=1 Tax=Burkholderia alba TaxID=2683677 RepID=UPI002B05AC90|nr:heme exporter protein CcmD [Burkholderia alba]
MNWHGAAEFLAMGGYGLYVWGAYAVTASTMLLELWTATHRQRRALLDATRARAEWRQ